MAMATMINFKICRYIIWLVEGQGEGLVENHAERDEGDVVKIQISIFQMLIIIQ